MAVFGAIYLGIATTVHMAIVLLAAQIAPLAAARTAPEYDPANSGVGPLTVVLVPPVPLPPHLSCMHSSVIARPVPASFA
jgi:hypothetical protein